MSGSTGGQSPVFDQQWRPSFYASQSRPGLGGRISRDLGLKLRFGSATVIRPGRTSAGQTEPTNGPRRRRTKLCKPHFLGWAGITHRGCLLRRLGRDTAQTIVRERRENGDLLREHIKCGSLGSTEATWGGGGGGARNKGKQEIEGEQEGEEGRNGGTGGIRWKLRLY